MAAVPGVEAVAGEKREGGAGRGKFDAEGGDHREFVFVGSVDDAGADTGAHEVFDDRSVVRDEGVELEVKVGVVEGSHGRGRGENRTGSGAAVQAEGLPE